MSETLVKGEQSGSSLGVDLVGQNDHLNVLIDGDKLSRLLVDELGYSEDGLSRVGLRVDVSQSIPRRAFRWRPANAVDLKRRAGETVVTLHLGRIYQYFCEEVDKRINAYLDGRVSDRDLYRYLYGLSRNLSGEEYDGDMSGFDRFHSEISSGRGDKDAKRSYLEGGWKDFLVKKGVTVYGQDQLVKGVARLDPKFPTYKEQEREALYDRIFNRLQEDDAFEIGVR